MLSSSFTCLKSRLPPDNTRRISSGLCTYLNVDVLRVSQPRGRHRSCRGHALELGYSDANTLVSSRDMFPMAQQSRLDVFELDVALDIDVVLQEDHRRSNVISRLSVLLQRLVCLFRQSWLVELDE
jgi:hypothetical protein